jgi:hypothetical protein
VFLILDFISVFYFVNRTERRALKKNCSKSTNTIDILKQLIETQFTEKYITEIGEFLQFIINPTNKFNPHKIMRQLPNDLFSYLYEKILSISILNVYKELFEIEYDWRQGLLKEDWRWVWLNRSEGTIQFLRK